MKQVHEILCRQGVKATNNVRCQGRVGLGYKGWHCGTQRLFSWRGCQWRAIGIFEHISEKPDVRKKWMPTWLFVTPESIGRHVMSYVWSTSQKNMMFCMFIQGLFFSILWKTINAKKFSVHIHVPNYLYAFKYVYQQKFYPSIDWDFWLVFSPTKRIYFPNLSPRSQRSKRRKTQFEWNIFSVTL